MKHTEPQKKEKKTATTADVILSILRSECIPRTSVEQSLVLEEEAVGGQGLAVERVGAQHGTFGAHRHSLPLTPQAAAAEMRIGRRRATANGTASSPWGRRGAVEETGWRHWYEKSAPL